MKLFKENIMIFFVFFHFPTALVVAQTHDNLKNLKKELFITNEYDPSIRPKRFQNESTEVFFDLYLLNINSINVVEQKMTTTVFLVSFWTDEMLTWDSEQYGGIENIFVPQGKIWRPDLAFQNGVEKPEDFGTSSILVDVQSSGDVVWSCLEIFVTKCSIDIFMFPFDKQNCSLEFKTWAYNSAEIKVQTGMKGFTMDQYSSNEEWTVLDTSVKRKENNLGSMVVFNLTMKRNPNYYITNIILPILLLSILLAFTFVIPADSGEKMGYVMTVYLSFAVFLTIVSSSFLVTSSMSVFSAYLIFLLSLGTGIVMITGLQLRIHFRSVDIPIPNICLIMVSCCRRCQYLSKNKNKIEAQDNMLETILEEPEGNKIIPNINMDINDEKGNKRGTVDVTWPDVTAAIDFVCFIFFVITVLTVTLVMFFVVH